jgi:hypothetical protein
VRLGDEAFQQRGRKPRFADPGLAVAHKFAKFAAHEMSLPPGRRAR